MNPPRFPIGTPGDIGASFTLTARTDADVTLACALCAMVGNVHQVTVRCGGEDTVLPKHVQRLARHLWTVHSLPVFQVAREGLEDDNCRCQFCTKRQFCTTPGDVSCKEGPSNG